MTYLSSHTQLQYLTPAQICHALKKARAALDQETESLREQLATLSADTAAEVEKKQTRLKIARAGNADPATITALGKAIEWPQKYADWKAGKLKAALRELAARARYLDDEIALHSRWT
jgi:hypothetical protein